MATVEKVLTAEAIQNLRLKPELGVLAEGDEVFSLSHSSSSWSSSLTSTRKGQAST